ncbi:MAG TPA: sigma-54 dependent transcriptional regulator [Polyangiaceae bacterium]|nr:sigma-54 dependent transcriptional regulator [Polyangiaceae bacterium]
MRQVPRVFIADEDATLVRLLSGSLVHEGYSCQTAASCDSVLESLRELDCDVAICGVRMPGLTEFNLLDRIRARSPGLPVIVSSTTGSIAEAVESVKRGACQYVARPFTTSHMVDMVGQAVTESGQQRQLAPPPAVAADLTDTTFSNLVHVSEAMRRLVANITLVARSDAPVLILGETGTGKERVARALHAGGARARKPFVAVNVSAIPEALLESEIFGHVRGAFTGATQPRRGLLAEADGGTLLLDEIGDMPLALQPKLLRVLQFGESRPVGSDRFGHVDVRVIAATHRDLSTLVREGRFRQDLRYRLSVIPLVVPPLRARREDIGPLAVQFLDIARERTPTSPVRSISELALALLEREAWPGNVRELENAIERLVVLGRESEVGQRELSFLHEGEPAWDAPEPNPDACWIAAEGSPPTLKQMNQHYLQWVLERTGGNKVLAARILDVDLSTLYRWARSKH